MRTATAVSNATPPVRTPSAADLVAMLSDEIPAPPPRDVVALPRPRWWLRVIVLGMIALLACFAGGAVVAASAVAQLAERLAAAERVAARPMLPPPPAAEILLDPVTYALARAQRPDDGTRLALGRVALLRQQGRLTEAEHTCAEAAASAQDAQLLITWAELLMDLGQPEAARARLDALIGLSVPEGLVTRIAALAGRIALGPAS